MNSFWADRALLAGLTTLATGGAVLGGPLLFYRASDGLASTGVVDNAGGFTHMQDVGGFDPGWTHITSAGNGRFLFYRSGDGLAATGVVDSAGNFTNLRTVGGFTPGWTHITGSLS